MQAYVETFILRAFYDGVRQASEYKSFAVVFEQLFHVFAIHTLRNQATDFIRVRNKIKIPSFILLFQLKLLTSDQIYQLETYSLPDMYARLRPNLVALVDAFEFHDNELSKYLRY